MTLHLTQVLTGHGCFRSYLKRIGVYESAECPTCPETALSPCLSCCPFDRYSLQKAEESFPVKSSWCPFISLRHPCHICCTACQVELVCESPVIATSATITDLPV